MPAPLPQERYRTPVRPPPSHWLPLPLHPVDFPGSASSPEEPHSHYQSQTTTLGPLDTSTISPSAFSADHFPTHTSSSPDDGTATLDTGTGAGAHGNLPQSRHPDDHHYSSSPPKKRPRTQPSRDFMSYPRKRAVTACRLCRSRKTKCSTTRPKCKFCSDTDAECVYEDQINHQSFDPASLLILERLGQLIERFDSQAASFPSSGISSFVSNVHPAPSLEPPPEHISASTPSSYVYAAVPGEQNDAIDRSDEEYMRIPSSRTTCEAVLMWPIFESRYPADYLLEPVLSASANCEDENEEPVAGKPRQRAGTAGNSRGVGANVALEENVLRLVENFIAVVHTKNPILDILTLKKYARRVAEDGPGWDGPSCLVLLACALGALAKPFPSSMHTLSLHASPSSVTNPKTPTSLEVSARDLDLSDYYYSIARKRIGLLGSTITRSQCYLLSGIYLMYTLHPMEAWQNFLQASTTYYIYLQGRMRNGKDDGDGDGAEVRRASCTRRLEQSLYWSCFKSECEIRVELSLPESTLAALPYPDLFPSPPVEEAVSSPSPSLASDSAAAIEHSSHPYFASPSSGSVRKQHAESMDEGQQQSWYYYLTEIALRRIGNRILNALYKNPNMPGHGIPVLEMLRIANDFEKQLGQWQSNLPPSLTYSQTDLHVVPTSELTFMVRGRTLEIQSWLYCPFLYYAIHHPPSDPYRLLIEPFVEKALVCGSAHIRGLEARHRHHGTWYEIRAATMAALCILAAAKSGVVDMKDGIGAGAGRGEIWGGMGEGGWRETVTRMIGILGFWEGEAADLGRAKGLLEELLEESFGEL